MPSLHERMRSEFFQIKGRRAKVRVQEIEDFARNHPESAWHGRLEWDDEIAGYKYRLWQIRINLAVLRLQNDVAEGEGAGQREIVSLSIDRCNGGGLRTIHEVMSDATLADVYLQDALDELERVRLKYQHLQQLRAVWSTIDRAVTRQGRRSGAERSPAKPRQAKLSKAGKAEQSTGQHGEA